MLEKEKAKTRSKKLVLTKYPLSEETKAEDQLLQQTLNQFDKDPNHSATLDKPTFQFGRDFSLLLYVIACFGLSGSMLYSKHMFHIKNQRVNPMEAAYNNCLALFCITLFLLMTYINNWFKKYRKNAHQASHNFKFIEDAVSYSES